MDNKLDNSYIDNAVEELIKVLGIKEDYSFNPLAKLLNAGKIQEAIQLVATYLRLPIKIQLSYVSDKYDPSQESEFQSRDLTKTDHAGKGMGGITAQVYIPSYLPFFGSPALENLPIKVKVSEDCARYPYTFIAVISHELSHILLASLSYKHKENEIYTDLTPMILGFSHIVKEGRRTVESKSETTNNLFSTSTRTNTTTITYGYLTDKQFVFAFNKIASIKKKCANYKKKIQQENVSYEKSVHHYERLYFMFNKYLEYVDTHYNQKINKNDVSMLIDLHQQLHKDTIEVTIKTNKSKLKHFDEKVGNIEAIDKSFNAIIFLNNLENIDSEIREAKSTVQLEIKGIKDKLNILKKYVSIFYRFRLYLGRE